MDKWNKEATLTWIASNIIIDNNGCHLWQGPLCEGYGKTGIRDIYDRWETSAIHRLVLRLHDGKEFVRGLQALHSCDVRNCCNVEHLRWGTATENSDDARERGRLRVGDRHAMAKLTNESVREIKRMIRAGMSNSQIVVEIGEASKSTVSMIRSGRTWRNVTL